MIKVWYFHLTASGGVITFSFSKSSSSGKWTLDRPVRRLPCWLIAWPSWDLWLAWGTDSVQSGKGLKSQPSCLSLGNALVSRHRIDTRTKIFCMIFPLSLTFGTGSLFESANWAVGFTRSSLSEGGIYEACLTNGLSCVLPFCNIISSLSDPAHSEFVFAFPSAKKCMIFR